MIAAISQGALMATKPLTQEHEVSASIDVLSILATSAEPVVVVVPSNESHEGSLLEQKLSQDASQEQAVVVPSAMIPPSENTAENPSSMLLNLDSSPILQVQSAITVPGLHKPVYVVPRSRKQGIGPPYPTIIPRNAFTPVTQTEQNSLRTSLLNRSAQFRMVCREIKSKILVVIFP